MGPRIARTLDEGWKMAVDEGSLKVTIRISPEDLNLLEDYMAEHGIENRSDCIREAIKSLVEKDNVEDCSQTGLFVHLNEIQKATLKGLVDLGIAVSEEEFVRRVLLEKIIPANEVESAISNAFRLAQKQSALK